MDAECVVTPLQHVVSPMTRFHFYAAGLAALLCCAGAAPSVAQATGGNESGNTGSQSVTGAQTHSQQESTTTPATGTAATVQPNAASQSYPGTVGPTGSTQPDATNPHRSQPSGGSKN
jgi:hypothetical protein